MAKISPVSIKYMIRLSFQSEGPVEKPDVIGAVFGQTEGLLGSELEMRELQKEGKIGRIEVDLETVDGKSVGEIQVPTALDKSETTIIAAALETIDRIGPTLAEVKVAKIEDVRGAKRDFIINRAKELLGGLDNEVFGELAKTVTEETRAAKIQEYGEEKLPAGDLFGKEVIVVEGRADVVNLLRNRVNNVIGMNGTKLPREIFKLGEEKELTLFVDGDRGGRLIARNVMDNAKIAYVAIAPDGKEVEELTGKEILQALRKKIPAREFSRMLGRNGFAMETTNREDAEVMPEEEEGGFEGDVKAVLREKYNTIKDSKMALLLDKNMDIIRRVSSRDVPRSIRYSKTRVSAVVIDGTANSMILKACEEKNVKYLGASNFGSVDVESSVTLVSL